MAVSGDAILPDFIVVGAMKAGTTSLFRSLSMHPEIGMSRDKETNFFLAEGNFRRGPKWYSRQFRPGFRFHGEASTNYTKVGAFGGVPERIKTYLPDVKLIYAVRDPVDRFVSQYRHSWAHGETSVRPEDLRYASEYEHILDVSCYARQLNAYLEHFDLKNILVVDFDHLTRNNTGVMNEIYDFIGTSPLLETTVGRFNDHAEISKVPSLVLRIADSRAGRAMSLVLDRERRDRIRRLLAVGRPRQLPKLPPDLIEGVREKLRPEMEAFRRLTGMAFSGWSV